MIVGVRLKYGVVLHDLLGRPHVWALLEAFRQTAPPGFEVIWITSTNEGYHSKNSHHYKMEAFDVSLRRQHFDPSTAVNREDADAWAARSRAWLQTHAPEAHYDVVVEYDNGHHMHGEWDHWKE